jgi:anti-sigma B factor antagonist
MEPFALGERDHGRGCKEIEVKGEVDLAVADQLQAAIDAVSSDYERIALNLEACEFIDSTAIAVILAVHQRLEEEGRRLFLCNPRDQVLRVLSITGLADGRLVVAGVSDALAAPSK